MKWGLVGFLHFMSHNGTPLELINHVVEKGLFARLILDGDRGHYVDVFVAECLKICVNISRNAQGQ
jgi:hypothetical protein